MRYVLTTKELRLLEKRTQVTLGPAIGQSVPAGTMVALGEPEEFWYDHRIRTAFPVLEFPKTFILEMDLDQTKLLVAEKTDGQQTIH